MMNLKKVTALLLIIIVFFSTPVFAADETENKSNTEASAMDIVSTQREDIIKEEVGGTETAEETDEPFITYASTTVIKKTTGYWDVRAAAGLKVPGYDVFQGACAHDGYAWFSLYNRDREKIRLVKVNLSKMEVVKVSATWGIKCHGNTLVYNPLTEEIVITCGRGGKTRLAFVDPNTLKLIRTQIITISEEVIGGKYKGIASLAYNESRNVFLMRPYGKPELLVITDTEFNVIDTVTIRNRISGPVIQGLYSEGDYILELQSYGESYNYNIISIRNMDTGKLIGRMIKACGAANQRYELEHVFRDETTGTWYAGFYRPKIKKNVHVKRRNYLFTIDNMPL